jgi:hypothetical protein
MILRDELKKRLLAARGIYDTEACDKCRQLLGPVRYTRAGDSGVWCSKECRGDAAQIIRKGGRPRKYRNSEHARTAKTAQQRDYRSPRLDVEKTTCIQPEFLN